MPTYTSHYPPSQDSTYVKATSEFSSSYHPYYATDPAKSVTGAAASNSWYSTYPSGGENQKFNIDLGSGHIIKRIYYENQHASGTETYIGVREYIFYGTNSATAFANTTYSDTTDLTELASGSFDQHVGTDAVPQDIADPKYITFENSTSYRYYVFRFQRNWWNSPYYYMGVRRIELQTEDEDESSSSSYIENWSSSSYSSSSVSSASSSSISSASSPSSISSESSNSDFSSNSSSSISSNSSESSESSNSSSSSSANDRDAVTRCFSYETGTPPTVQWELFNDGLTFTFDWVCDEELSSQSSSSYIKNWSSSSSSSSLSSLSSSSSNSSSSISSNSSSSRSSNSSSSHSSISSESSSSESSISSNSSSSVSSASSASSASSRSSYSSSSTSSDSRSSNSSKTSSSTTHSSESSQSYSSKSTISNSSNSDASESTYSTSSVSNSSKSSQSNSSRSSASSNSSQSSSSNSSESSESSESSNDYSSISSSSSGDDIWVTGNITSSPSALGRYTLTGNYNGYAYYTQNSSEAVKWYIWRNLGWFAWPEDSRNKWILSRALGGGVIYHWYSPVISSTVYYGGYSPVGTVGIAYVESEPGMSSTSSESNSYSSSSSSSRSSASSNSSSSISSNSSSSSSTEFMTSSSESSGGSTLCASGFTTSAINGQYDYFGMFEGKSVYRKGIYYIFYDVTNSKWYLDTHIQTTPVTYSAYSLTQYIGGLWHDVAGNTDNYFIAEGECSSSSSSSFSSSSESSSSQPEMYCQLYYTMEGCSDTTLNGRWDVTGTYTSSGYTHPVYTNENSGKVCWWHAPAERYLESDVVGTVRGSGIYWSMLDRVYDPPYTQCPNGQWRDSVGTEDGWMYELDASSSSSSSNSSDSSSSNSSDSSSSNSSESSLSSDSSSSLSSLMGCNASYNGAGFFTYSLANSQFDFVGYEEGKPKYHSTYANYDIIYNGMGSGWLIKDQDGFNILYSVLDTPCPNGNYKRVSDDELEGTIS